LSGKSGVLGEEVSIGAVTKHEEHGDMIVPGIRASLGRTPSLAVERIASGGGGLSSAASR
jgi:hypothetical protein